MPTFAVFVPATVWLITLDRKASTISNCDKETCRYSLLRFTINTGNSHISPQRLYSQICISGLNEKLHGMIGTFADDTELGSFVDGEDS